MSTRTLAVAPMGAAVIASLAACQTSSAPIVTTTVSAPSVGVCRHLSKTDRPYGARQSLRCDRTAAPSCRARL
jgi:hypothetical protein